MLINSVKEFKDVKSGQWYVYYIDFAVGPGMFAGTSETTFEPLAPITRAMFVTVLARIAGVELNNKQSTSFTDVTSGKWFTGAVVWAASKGITEGTSKTTFSPTRNITRQEICTMIVRYSDREGILLETNVTPVTFTDDGSIASWAKSAVYLCQKNGLINGHTDGSFKPTQTATRSEVAKILTMYYKYNRRSGYDNYTSDEAADW